MEILRPSRAVVLFASCLFLFQSSNAFASLVGDTIVADATWNNSPVGVLPLLTNSQAVVGSEVEFAVPIPLLGGSQFAIDFSDTSNVFSVTLDPADLGVWPVDVSIYLSDLFEMGSTEVIASVTQIENSEVGFLDNISFTGNSITLLSDPDAMVFGATFTEVFQYTTARIPEPTILTLMGLSFTGFCLSRRRRKSSSICAPT